LIFNESSFSNCKYAFISGIKDNFDPFSQLLTLRHIQKGYQADFSNYESSMSSGENEESLNYRIQYKSANLSIISFMDIFRNIENNEIHNDRINGFSYGIKAEKYGFFSNENTCISIFYREKQDLEWRNLSGVSKYESRKREYYSVSWQQFDNEYLKIVFRYDLQYKKYLKYDISNHGSVFSNIITYNFENFRLSSSSGVFDCKIPIYHYSYNGRYNYPILVLSGEGMFANIILTQKLKRDFLLELMSSIVSKKKDEYVFSFLLSYNI
jgi:hypothetical protein